MAQFDISKYAHSSVHKAIILKDYDGLNQILSGLPKLCDPFEIETESASIAEEKKAAAISAVVDRRDVPNQDTPLHLASKIGDEKAVELLMVFGANKNLKNNEGWSALTEAIRNKQEKIALIMIRESWQQLDQKVQRRLPLYVGTMRRMRDFYMEISFHFESSVIPFISRIAPSDTYKIWKRGGNMRADMTLAGFDGLKIKRADQSVLFLGDGLDDGKKLRSSFCMMSHKNKEVVTLEGSAPPTERQIRQRLVQKSQDTLVKIGIDVTQAVLEPQITWRRKERKETVGQWKAKVYDMHNVVLSVKSRKPPDTKTDPKFSSNQSENDRKEINEILTEEERKQLDAALASKMDSMEPCNEDENCYKNGEKKGKHRGGRKEKDQHKGKHIKAASMDSGNISSQSSQKDGNSNSKNEYKRGMRPTIWLSSDFPLKFEELLPLLDILAEKVKAVRRLRELLTTKLPKGTFPVKVAIPVVPTVRVLISFTKFEELPPIEEFSSAPSSPSVLDEEEEPQLTRSSFWFQWMKSSTAGSNSANTEDLFTVPFDYTWITFDEKIKRDRLKNRQNTTTMNKVESGKH